MRDTADEGSSSSLPIGIIPNQRTYYRHTWSTRWILFGRYLTSLHSGSLAHTRDTRKGDQVEGDAATGGHSPADMQLAVQRTLTDKDHTRSVRERSKRSEG